MPNANLATNWSFETDASGWSANTVFGTWALASSLTSSTDRATHGVRSLKVAWGTSEPTKPCGVVAAFGGVQGAHYLYEADVFVPSGSPDVRLTGVFAADVDASEATTSVKDEWVRLRLTFSPASAGTLFFGVVTTQPRNAAGIDPDGGVVYVDNVSVTYMQYDTGLGVPPLLGASRWERAAYQGGARPIARVTVEVDGRDPIDLTVHETDLEVTRTLTRGTQWLASVTVAREPGQNTEDLVLTPGAIFRIWHGFDYGANTRELRPYGVYQLAKMPTLDRREQLQLELHDRWSQIAECKSIIPTEVFADTDPGEAIRGLVQAVDPTIPVVVNAHGEPLPDDLEDTDRANLIIEIARRAAMYPHFDAEGRFVIDPMPSESSPVASLSDGENATLLGVQSEAVFTTPYNCVVVDTGDPYDPYVLHLADTTHPRHRSKPGMGVRPYFTESPLEDGALRQFASGLLAQLVGGVTRRTFTTWARGDLNPGDWITVIEAGTYQIPQRTSVSMVEEIRHNPLTVETQIVTRSVPRVLTEED